MAWPDGTKSLPQLNSMNVDLSSSVRSSDMMANSQDASYHQAVTHAWKLLMAGEFPSVSARDNLANQVILGGGEGIHFVTTYGLPFWTILNWFKFTWTLVMLVMTITDCDTELSISLTKVKIMTRFCWKLGSFYHENRLFFHQQDWWVFYESLKTALVRASASRKK